LACPQAGFDPELPRGQAQPVALWNQRDAA
jgi:hypothetical protein